MTGGTAALSNFTTFVSRNAEDTQKEIKIIEIRLFVEELLHIAVCVNRNVTGILKKKHLLENRIAVGLYFIFDSNSVNVELVIQRRRRRRKKNRSRQTATPTARRSISTHRRLVNELNMFSDSG